MFIPFPSKDCLARLLLHTQGTPLDRPYGSAPSALWTNNIDIQFVRNND